LRISFSRYAPLILATKGKWLRFPGFDYPQSASALREAVLEIIRHRQASGEPKHDFLNFLLRARDRRTGESLNESQLLNEVMTLIFAGSETTEKPLAWIWCLLSQNPEWMESIYQCADLDSFFHADAAAEEQCAVNTSLYETMRLYPPAWILGRRALEDDRIGGEPVSGGDDVVINIFALHHHPAHWPEPGRFDPQRFLPRKSAQTDGLVYLPFGAGPRKCLGDHLAMLEMRIIVGMIARRFRLEMVAGQDVSARPNISLSPKKEIFFRLIPRQSI
jgi:cytochrome P450